MSRGSGPGKAQWGQRQKAETASKGSRDLCSARPRTVTVVSAWLCSSSCNQETTDVVLQLARGRQAWCTAVQRSRQGGR